MTKDEVIQQIRITKSDKRRRDLQRYLRKIQKEEARDERRRDQKSAG